jgi:elongation factor Ts
LTNQMGEGHGKPAEIVDKIVNGKLRKFYESVCLTEQAHMIEECNPKVGSYLADCGLRIVSYEALSVA